MNDLYKSCKLCPKKCGVNRFRELGSCFSSSKVKVAKACLYFYEEPSISGINGSGTIFFSGCNLKCCYCQNKKISLENYGKEISVLELANLMINLQNKKAHNINLVSPTHFIPSIIEAIKLAKKMGLTIPIVYNTSGYESLDSLKLLEGYIDIYLTDFRYFDNDLALKLSGCFNYIEVTKEAIKQMYRQVEKNVFNSKGIMIKGVIVRCLILPTKSSDTKRIINYLYKTYGDNIYFSIMNQYTPVWKNNDFDFLNKTVSHSEYQNVILFALSLGICNAYIQDGDTCSVDYIPNFDLEGV